MLDQKVLHSQQQSACRLLRILLVPLYVTLHANQGSFKLCTLGLMSVGADSLTPYRPWCPWRKALPKYAGAGLLENPSCTITKQSLVAPGIRRLCCGVGVQLLRELQQHKLFSLVEASLKQKSQRDAAMNGSVNGSPSGTTPQQGSAGEPDIERVTVYLLLTPVTSWEAVRSLVRWLPSHAWKLKDVQRARMGVPTLLKRQYSMLFCKLWMGMTRLSAGGAHQREPGVQYAHVAQVQGKPAWEAGGV